MNQTMAIFGRLYPLEERKLAQSKLALVFGLVVFAVLFVLNPFENSRDTLLSNSAYAGLLTFVSIVFDFWVLFALFPQFFKEEKWTIGREIIFTFIIICTIGTFNILAGRLVWGTPLSVANWLRMIFYTAVIGIAPATASILINQARLLKKYRREVTIINDQMLPVLAKTATEILPLPKKIDAATTPIKELNLPEFITIEAENEKDKLTIPAACLIAATSADNYVKVFYLQNEQLKTAMLRTTLKKLEENVASTPSFFRCHRTAVVNLNAVENVTGTAQGYRLQFQHLSEEIPVSRNLNAVIKDRLAAIRP